MEKGIRQIEQKQKKIKQEKGEEAKNIAHWKKLHEEKRDLLITLIQIQDDRIGDRITELREQIKKYEEKGGKIDKGTEKLIQESLNLKLNIKKREDIIALNVKNTKDFIEIQSNKIGQLETKIEKYKYLQVKLKEKIETKTPKTQVSKNIENRE